MSDRIGVMDRARIVQIGSPTQIYEEPSSLFVTTPSLAKSNVLDVTSPACRRGDGDSRSRWPARHRRASRRPCLAGQVSKLVVRPENISCWGRPRLPPMTAGSS